MNEGCFEGSSDGCTDGDEKGEAVGYTDGVELASSCIFSTISKMSLIPERAVPILALDPVIEERKVKIIVFVLNVMFKKD